MQTALLLCAVDPRIGGVLVRGQKGTAKSTTARSLAAVLPSIEIVTGCPFRCNPQTPEQLHDACHKVLAEKGELPRETIRTPFVDLPLSATEDRLVGTLNLEGTLRTGQRQFDPGLFASAHRGIIYVDEVNLLPDHLVDILLDTAASGVNLVEREGLTFSHASRFILVGTMNPEEGELRPQFLDRFGLCVTITGLDDVSMRQEIIKRRLAYDDDPASFLDQYVKQEDLLRQQVLKARESLGNVIVPEGVIQHAAEIATRARTQGHRAELILVRAARALAALMDNETVTEKDLAEVAGFALTHRFQGHSIMEQNALQAKITELFSSEPESGSAIPVEKSQEDIELMENMNFPGSAAAGSMLFTYLKKKIEDRYFSADESIKLGEISLETIQAPLNKRGVKKGAINSENPGRRTGNRKYVSGDYCRALDIGKTISSALIRRTFSDHPEEVPLLHVQDVFFQVRSQRPKRLIVFVIDTSDSMADSPNNRMSAALGAITSLASTAYMNRDQVSLVTFRDHDASVVVPPTTSVTLIKQRANHLPVGGATPLAQGLQTAHSLLEQQKRKDSSLIPLMVLISDGDATMPMKSGSDPRKEALESAYRIAQKGISALIIDTSIGQNRRSCMRQLAKILRSPYHNIHNLNANQVLNLIEKSGRNHE